MENLTINLARKSVEELSRLIEEKFTDVDVDFIDNVLNIETSDEQTLVVSIHEPTCQIWYSSPLSGALHFKHEKNNAWINTRDEHQKFPNIVLKEIEFIENENR